MSGECSDCGGPVAAMYSHHPNPHDCVRFLTARAEAAEREIASLRTQLATAEAHVAVVREWGEAMREHRAAVDPGEIEAWSNSRTDAYHDVEALADRLAKP